MDKTEHWYLELIYRRFLKTGEDSYTYIYEIEETLKELIDNDNLSFDEVKQVYWPINPEEIESLQNKGYILVDYNNEKCIVIRELRVKVELNLNNHLSVLKAVHSMGDIFIINREIKETRLGVQAL